MSSFKFLKINVFEYQLKIYELIHATMQNVRLQPESYQQNFDALIESTFLQLYSHLEESLYQECEEHFIKKKASISRFEKALEEQGFTINNEHWRTLLSIAKIRNCLLHGNGRLDADQYGIDTQETIHALNCNANISLIELINLKGYRDGSYKIKINPTFLPYCVVAIKNFIDSQKQ